MDIRKKFAKYVSQNIFGMLGISCYVVADTFFISKFAGADGITVLNLVLPVFNDKNDPNGMSKEAYYFIGGLMKHIKAMTFITNPIVNSYKRFVPGFEAPVHIAWSRKNRTPLIRIPADRGGNVRIELRSPDTAANPYLALAVCLAAGLDGIRSKIMPPDSIDRK